MAKRSRDEHVARLLGNPFLEDPAAFRASGERLLGGATAKRLRELDEEGDHSGALRLGLALAHARVTIPDADSITPKGPHARLSAEVEAVAAAAGRCHAGLVEMVGGSKVMARTRAATWAACFGESLYHALRLRAVVQDHDVLILGETGTGKEGIARVVQAGCIGATTAPAPSAALNAAAVPETLVESALFGHVKGAFTGARGDRLGAIRTADGGSFFLDEVGDLARETQVKLLRVMETNQVQPLGADHGETVHVRYVAATHRDLDGMVDAGAFRRDLYQRLAGVVLHTAPLRERRGDIPEIGAGFIDAYLGDHDLGPLRERTMRWLRRAAKSRHPWLGNVRELQNALRSVLLGLDPELESAGGQQARESGDLPPTLANNEGTLDDARAWYVARVVEAAGGNITEAARRLGVDRATVRRLLGR